MGIGKKLLKPRVIVWGATTILLVAFMAVATVLTTKTFKGLLEGVFGSDTAITKEGEGGIAFEQEFFTKDDARENGNKVVKEICEEGMVLLKNENNALPLKPNAKVSVFGKNSVRLVYGGSGSAAPGGNIPKKTIFESLEAAGIAYNPTLKSFYEDNGKSGKGRDDNPPMENGGVESLPTGETPIASYDSSITSSYDNYGDAALVVISRIAGENWDLPRKAQDDPSRHYLELDNNERALLKHIADSGKFEHIILLLNGSNYIDLGFLKMSSDPAYAEFGNKVDGAIVIGSVGGNGIMALGEILSGKVNPSGHTVDTCYTHYENDPTWQNFGDGISDNLGSYKVTKSNGKVGWAGYFFVEYEENIYMGYRYYETRGHIEGEDWYNANVVYPFGHGLSYTTFSQEVVNKEALQAANLNANEEFTVQIKVKNTGSVAGKQVVQLYAEAPYTNGGIEKSYKVLAGFAKTQLLQPNAEETVEIKVNPYDFASFDNHDKNANGKKCYELDAGEYTFHLGTDAHNDFDTFKKTLSDTAVFENDPVTNNKVEPLFDEVTEHMAAGQNLSRSDFAGTFPVQPTDAERTITLDDVAKFDSYNSTNDEVYTELPTMGADVTVEFKELAGKDYNDPLWDEFLDQLTFGDMLKLFNDGCYSTPAITRDGNVLVPATTSADGPTGFVAFLGNPAVYDCCYYMSECLLAQTYNLELATKQAHAIGNESLVGYAKGDGLPYPGWYAPAVNLHRSPFSGRNTEYYSEDPFISGRFAGQVIKGVQELGVYCNVKHYAVNDQETNRSAKGLATWLDEQCMRELYLKPFEMAVKEGKSHGLMTSFNRIGYEWAGGSYRLVTTILRKEWGFQGSVICDFKTDSYMDSKQMLYAGGDIGLIGQDTLKLQTSGVYNSPYVTPTDPKDANLLRRSAHNNLFALANSNIMAAEIIGYKLATWKVLVYVFDGVLSAGLLTWGFFAIWTALRKKDEVAAASEAAEQS